MKKHQLLMALVTTAICCNYHAQVFTPIVATGYTLDAIAENTTSTVHTTGAIDGSNYVMYSAAYGTMMGSTYGLPNSGLISSGTRTYQLEPYNQANVLFLTANTIDSLVVTTPTAYAGLSLIGFATEGAGSMNVTLRFTDNTTAIYNNLTLPDWFVASANTILSGFDRCNRTSGTPQLTAGSAGNPRMVYVDMPISCLNRVKDVKSIKIHNVSTNARLCIMAVSGAMLPSFTASSSPVTCSGGTNGSATVSVLGGVGPYNYSIQTTPVTTNSVANNLGLGTYSYTAQDAGLCPVTGTFAVTQSLAVQPPLNVTANSTNICMGSTVAIGANGAASYTWDSGSNSAIIILTPTATMVYTVSGLTSANCLRDGSITINVNPMPLVSLSGVPANVCLDGASINLVTSPTGGVLSGQGLLGLAFSPSLAGVGTKTLNYSYTDANNCSGNSSLTVIVNALPVVSFTAATDALCLNGSTINLNGSPAGGNFSGTGVSGMAFSPSTAGVGNHVLTYSYTDANSCSSSATSAVIVNALPSVSVSMQKYTFCVNMAVQLINGSPTGGTFSGPGTNGSIFTPSLATAGTHTIVYTYADSNTGCISSAALTTTVGACTSLNEEKVSATFNLYPNPNDGKFVIKAKEKISLEFINQLGQIIEIINIDENEVYTHNTSLNSGVYYLVDRSNYQMKSKLIVK